MTASRPLVASACDRAPPVRARASPPSTPSSESGACSCRRGVMATLVTEIPEYMSDQSEGTPTARHSARLPVSRGRATDVRATMRHDRNQAQRPLKSCPFGSFEFKTRSASSCGLFRLRTSALERANSASNPRTCKRTQRAACTTGSPSPWPLLCFGGSGRCDHPTAVLALPPSPPASAAASFSTLTTTAASPK